MTDPNNTHTPVLTHEKKKKRSTPSVQGPSIFAPMTSIPTTTKRDVDRMDEIGADYNGVFPNVKGLFIHGSWEAGKANLQSQMERNENTDTKSRNLLLRLIPLYKIASDLRVECNVTSSLELGSTVETRRALTKSDEVKGPFARRRHPDAINERKLLSITKKIYHLEASFEFHRRAKDQEIETNKIKIEHLEAIEFANEGMLIQSLRDYWGALSQDFKDSEVFKQPQFQGKLEFLKKERFSEIVVQYDKEMARIANGTSMSAEHTPMVCSLKAAVEYTGNRYSGVEEVMTFIRCYAEGNTTVHPVKDIFTVGDHYGLRRKMIEDKNSASFFGQPETRARFQEHMNNCLDLVAKHFFRGFQWDPSRSALPSRAMTKLAKIYTAKRDAKNRGETESEDFSFSDNDSFQDEYSDIEAAQRVSFEYDSSEEEFNLKEQRTILKMDKAIKQRKAAVKGQKKREGSLARDAEQDEATILTIHYEWAVQECEKHEYKDFGNALKQIWKAFQDTKKEMSIMQSRSDAFKAENRTLIAEAIKKKAAIQILKKEVKDEKAANQILKKEVKDEKVANQILKKEVKDLKADMKDQA